MDPEFARIAVTAGKYVTYAAGGVASTVVAYRALTGGKITASTIAKVITYPLCWGFGTLTAMAFGYQVAHNPDVLAKGSVEFTKQCNIYINNSRIARGQYPIIYNY